MKILLTLLVLLFSSSVVAEDISDFEIEGISVGDSLLDYMSEDEILKSINKTKKAYNYLTDEFGEVYLYNNLNKYDRLSFFVKPEDENYFIYHLKGSISYNDKIEQCFIKQKEIEKEFSLTYKNAEKREGTFYYPWDQSGESSVYIIEFSFNNGGHIEVKCAQFKKSLKIENNWEDSLQITIGTEEVAIWFDNPID